MPKTEPNEFLVEKAPLRKELKAVRFNNNGLYSGEVWIKCIEYDAYWSQRQAYQKAVKALYILRLTDKTNITDTTLKELGEL